MDPQTLSQIIQKKFPDFKPKLAIVLGSGLADFSNKLDDSVSIPYQELTGFPVSQVSGHPGRLILGKLNGVPIVCCQGRVHAYEGMQAKDFKLFIRTLKCLGCRSIIMTNATGSLRENLPPGQLVLISDHINLQPGNPLVGPNDEDFGPRFLPMDEVYDKKIRHVLQHTANQLHISLKEGIYMSVLGPCFETPAEIRAFQILGADVIGMSTIPEVIVARHCGMKLGVISVVTNLAAGLSKEPITHEGTLYHAAQAGSQLGELLHAAIKPLAELN